MAAAAQLVKPTRPLAEIIPQLVRNAREDVSLVVGRASRDEGAQAGTLPKITRIDLEWKVARQTEEPAFGEGWTVEVYFSPQQGISHKRLDVAEGRYAIGNVYMGTPIGHVEAIAAAERALDEVLSVVNKLGIRNVDSLGLLIDFPNRVPSAVASVWTDIESFPQTLATGVGSIYDRGAVLSLSHKTKGLSIEMACEIPLNELDLKILQRDSKLAPQDRNKIRRAILEAFSQKKIMAMPRWRIELGRGGMLQYPYELAIEPEE